MKKVIQIVASQITLPHYEVSAIFFFKYGRKYLFESSDSLVLQHSALTVHNFKTQSTLPTIEILTKVEAQKI